MAREFSKQFYNSKEWRDCRKRYIQLMPRYKRGLCEDCYDKGIHKLGLELHHKIELTPKNIHDRNITLNHDNLIFLCYECHKKRHIKEDKRNYIIDEYGNILPINK